jgi:hypothetical protein
MALYGHLTTSHPRQKTNFYKLCYTPLLLCVKRLPFTFADRLNC